MTNAELIEKYSIKDDLIPCFEQFISLYGEDKLEEYWDLYAEIEDNHGGGALTVFLFYYDLSDLESFEEYYMGAFDDECEYAESHIENDESEEDDYVVDGDMFATWENLAARDSLDFENGYVFKVKQDR